MNKYILPLLLLFSPLLHSVEYKADTMKYPDILPWFTGPILTPVKQILPPGVIGIEPFFVYQNFFGEYDNNWKTKNIPDFHVFRQLTIIEAGLTNFLDIQLFPQWWVQSSQGATSTRFGDFGASFNFQLIRDDEDPRVPTLLIFVREVFPTGQYQKLDPDLFETDAVGTGTYQTTIGFTLAHLYHFQRYNFLSLRANFSYTISTSAHVQGFNTYGGGFGTDAKVSPGNLFEAFFSFEYSFTRNWAITADLAYFSKAEDKTSGFRGLDRNCCPAKLGFPHADQISLAPGFEYNVSDTLGFLFGTWFPLAGRNSDRFYSAIFAFYKVF